ncbi:hypothetical protein HO133_010960 [Letharia lupina]|uniref:AB hydrolase-1 domain-containing protein n=1 Tax=Letharia lupina TaxID=560253 RepID=A0A8H6CIV3_9LECA|nr:uncharacterized protein HO133_010960 [Letharia lupina]KAF6224383.1 hypothetical protein HO133_010960 [Letharia lupina]
MPYLTIPHGRIFYTDFPPHDSPPRATLIFHHGLGSTHAFYRSITPALTSPPHNFRCITYDTISSGLSDLASEPQSMQGLAQDAIEVLDELGVKEKAIFVGHSMGGVVASEIAATKGDRIKGSVMLGPPLPSPTVEKTFEGRVKAVEEGGMEAMADTIPTGATGSKSTPLQHAFIRTLLLSQRPEGYCSMCKALGGASPPDYAAIKMPTLMVAGEEDKSAPLAGCEEIFKRTGGEKSMEVVKGMGHWFCIEDPESIAKLIGAFVEKVIQAN